MCHAGERLALTKRTAAGMPRIVKLAMRCPSLRWTVDIVLNIPLAARMSNPHAGRACAVRYCALGAKKSRISFGYRFSEGR
jgi:hypothetical protein